ncbi:hypothetical protein [Rhizobium leguminosarum]|uniref:hypothetical protein n=1 Tax=Rhizobium leguminosarum TaxID=384 RepID=UPI001C927138|nr:hypothetical protein [Rhizobium leguminosarum]MBY3025438.1 hypothetical protein [Rhizobium leguminosarum]
MKKSIINRRRDKRYVSRDEKGKFASTTSIERVVKRVVEPGGLEVTELTEETFSESFPKRTRSSKLAARPIKDRVDPSEFAADLLVSDKIIMDYLAK